MPNPRFPYPPHHARTRAFPIHRRNRACPLRSAHLLRRQYRKVRIFRPSFFYRERRLQKAGSPLLAVSFFGTRGPLFVSYPRQRVSWDEPENPRQRITAEPTSNHPIFDLPVNLRSASVNPTSPSGNVPYIIGVTPSLFREYRTSARTLHFDIPGRPSHTPIQINYRPRIQNNPPFLRPHVATSIYLNTRVPLPDLIFQRTDVPTDNAYPVFSATNSARPTACRSPSCRRPKITLTPNRSHAWRVRASRPQEHAGFPVLVTPELTRGRGFLVTGMEMDGKQEATSSDEGNGSTGSGSGIGGGAIKRVLIGQKPLSCTKCFDALWFCYSPVHQMQQYYRLGEFDTCFNKWSALYDCLKLKTKTKAMAEDIIEALESAKPHIWKFRTVDEASANWGMMFGSIARDP